MSYRSNQTKDQSINDYTVAEAFGSWCGSITLSDSQAIFRLFDPTILERLVVSRIADGSASRRHTNALRTDHNLDAVTNALSNGCWRKKKEKIVLLFCFLIMNKMNRTVHFIQNNRHLFLRSLPRAVESGLRSNPLSLHAVRIVPRAVELFLPRTYLYRARYKLHHILQSPSWRL